jgi:hypothetical protein
MSIPTQAEIEVATKRLDHLHTAVKFYNVIADMCDKAVRDKQPLDLYAPIAESMIGHIQSATVEVEHMLAKFKDQIQ